MKQHTQTVSIRTPEGDTPIGTVTVGLYETWDEIPPGERAKVIKDANRQRIQDAANAFREDHKNGGTRALKHERDGILAKLAAGTHTPEDLVRLAQVATQIG